jgi:hypothetical protein
MVGKTLDGFAPIGPYFVSADLVEHSLALHLREFAEVAVSPEQIEGVVDKTILLARSEFGLEFGEIRPSLVDDDHFAVEDRQTRNIQRVGDHGEALRPVQPVAGEYPLFSLVQMNLDPVTVELDFMEPLVAGRRLGLQRGQLRLDEPGISAEADAATTVRARLVITLLKTPTYRGTLKDAD